jgi:hypothetical protein
LGRFTSVDPIGAAASHLENPQSTNLYAYVENNPIDYIDPTGLSKIAIFTCHRFCVDVGDGNPSCEWECGWEEIEIGGGGGFPPPISEPPPGGVEPPSTPPPPTDDPIYCNSKIIDAMKKAWMRSGNGTRNTEAGFLAYEKDGKIDVVNLPNTNQFDKITFKPNEILPPNATLLGVFHTHPTNRSKLPSVGEKKDSDTAKQLDVPVFIMHRWGLSSIDPQGNISEDIRKNLDWQKPCGGENAK